MTGQLLTWLAPAMCCFLLVFFAAAARLNNHGSLGSSFAWSNSGLEDKLSLGSPSIPHANSRQNVLQIAFVDCTNAGPLISNLQALSLLSTKSKRF
jgi:hypothetical protein